MPAGVPSQITDLGGLPDKQGTEDLAAAGDVSLGTGGNEPSVSPGPARIAPANESLNLGGGVSEYIANSGTQGNIPSDGLSFGQGQGKPLQPMTEIEQQRSTAVDKALYVYQHSTILYTECGSLSSFPSFFLFSCSFCIVIYFSDSFNYVDI